MSTAEQSYPTIECAELVREEAYRKTATDRGRWIVGLLWLGAACSVTGMAFFLASSWDSNEYLAAVRRGVSGLPYSPLFMIPTLKVARLLPIWLVIALFGVSYLSGWLVQLWVGMQCATVEERRILRYVAPIIAFFSGLLISDIIVSGNLAYILYGMMLGTASLGWKRGHWNWFYVAVLAAACVKVHLLTVLAIPLLCGRRQWMRGATVGGVGLALYAAQCRIFPQLFDAYLDSLKHMSRNRSDFGCGPAGNLARILQSFGIPHAMPCAVFYACYAIAMFVLLLWLARLYHEQRISFESWAPVMLVGVVLLNPRIQPYDVAAISLPMAILAWRSLREDGQSARRPVLIGSAIVLLVLNVLVELNEDWVTVLPDAWKYLEMCLLLGVFAFGVRGLLREAGVAWASRTETCVADSVGC